MATSEMAYGVPVVSVIGDGFCVPYPVELIIKRTHKSLTNVCYQVLDTNGNLYFQVDCTLKNLQQKVIMRDPAGFPILTMREKVLSSRQRWTVHRGESKEQKDLLFTVQRAHFLQIKTKLEIFLANNFNKEACNFSIIGIYHSDQSFQVYKGDMVIAEANHSLTWDSVLEGKDDLRLKINPGVDYAFIVALTTIFFEIDSSII